MSKLSEHYLQIQEQEFELELSYQEWLRDNIQEPTSDELDEMEISFLTKPTTVKNRSIAQTSLNNTNYYPRGA